MADVVIVGGGVIGCATAYYLAQAGASVTVLERGALGSEASGAAAGMLAALSDEGGDRGPAFQTLCLDSLSVYATLIPALAETGVDLRYRASGVLHLALSQAEAAPLHERFEAQRDLSPASRWLAGAELRAEEPDASPKAVAALLSPDEHYLDPVRLVEALVAAGRRLGVRYETGAAVTRLLHSGSRLTGVRTATASFAADAVLLAAGAWTRDLAARLGASVPVRPVRGQMLSLQGPQTPLRHVIWGARGYLVPREAGQTFVGASVEDVGFRKRNTASALATLRRAAGELVPSLSTATQVRAWAGFRPAAPDALPVLGLLPGWTNAWVATGHFRNGILLAPITGQVMAESIIAGRPAPRLAPFAPSRFLD